MGVPPAKVEEVRAKVEDLLSRSGPDGPHVNVSARVTRAETRTGAGAAELMAQRAAELTGEERARREAYVVSHPDLTAGMQQLILSGLFLPAMKFDEVEQVLGPVQPSTARTPGTMDNDPEVSVYMAPEGGGMVYLFFREGKLQRWSRMHRI